MDRWYLSSPIDTTRAATLNCAIYGPISPWMQTPPLPAVILSNVQEIYTTIHDDGLITSSTVDTAAAPFLALEQAAAQQQALVTAAASRLQNVITTLNNMATQAQGTTVTSGNAVAVLQTVVNDLGIFCARLADLLQSTGFGT